MRSVTQLFPTMKKECNEILNTIGVDHKAAIIVKTGEGILFDSYNASENKYPEGLLFATNEDELISELSLWASKEYKKINPKRKYLWVVGKNEIRLALESTRNEKSSRGFICHTNITGDGEAIIGGEMWFLQEGDNYKIHFNFKSGRYPAADINTNKGQIKALLQCVGYSNIEFIESHV